MKVFDIPPSLRPPSPADRRAASCARLRGLVQSAGGRHRGTERAAAPPPRRSRGPGGPPGAPGPDRTAPTPAVPPRAAAHLVGRVLGGEPHQLRAGARPARGQRPGGHRRVEQRRGLGKQRGPRRLVEAVRRGGRGEERGFGQPGQQEAHPPEVEGGVGTRHRDGQDRPGSLVLGSRSGTITTKARSAARGSRAAQAPPVDRGRPRPVPRTRWPPRSRDGRPTPRPRQGGRPRPPPRRRPRPVRRTIPGPGTGICERTVTASASWPMTPMATRAARCEASSASPAPSPSLRRCSERGGLDLHLHVAVEGDGQYVETRPRFAVEAGARARIKSRISAGARSAGEGVRSAPPVSRLVARRDDHDGSDPRPLVRAGPDGSGRDQQSLRRDPGPAQERRPSSRPVRQPCYRPR